MEIVEQNQKGKGFSAIGEIPSKLSYSYLSQQFPQRFGQVWIEC